jgi:tripartite-type tricarboxylate transporter receptor subunit TctC
VSDFRPKIQSCLGFALAVATVLAVTGGVRADPFPSKPIKLIAAFAPGGPADIMARLIAAGISPILGQNVFVENHPGGGGTLGSRDVAKSQPDGYTLLLANTANVVISPLLIKDAGYDPAEAFTAVANLGTTADVLIASNASGLKSVQQVIAFARSNPGKLNFSSAGIGTPLHLNGEMFKQKLGLDLVHVPYKSGGQATQAVIAGETQICFDSREAALPAIENANVRALAVTGDKRLPQLPNVPTMIEAGVPGFVTVTFTGIAAPAGTPREIVDKLNAAINQALQGDQVRPVLAKLAVQPQIGSAAAFTAFLQQQRLQWGAVIKLADIQASE